MRYLALAFSLMLTTGCRELSAVAEEVSPTCADLLQNGDETDVDCGGSCDPCPVAGACLETSDCDGGACSGGACAPPSCTDGLHNGTESDVDCGYACGPCDAGLLCSFDGDCASEACSVAGRCLRVYDGNIVVTSPDDFGQLDGVELLRGSLTILSRGVTTIPALPLAEVTGSITVERNFDLVDLAGLGTLERVGGDLNIASNEALTALGDRVGETGLWRLDEVGGSITVEACSQLVDLRGLEALRQTGGLEIRGNPELASLGGVEALEAVFGNLHIEQSPSLTSLAGLESLRLINGDLVLTGDDALVDLVGLPSLTDVSGNVDLVGLPELTGLGGAPMLEFIGGTLRIEAVPQITDIPALTNLNTIVGGLVIQGNDSLTGISGFAGLEFVGGTISIANNPVLESVSGFEALVVVEGMLGVGATLTGVPGGNEQLERIDGFGALTTVGSLRIEYSAAIETIDGFGALTTVDGVLGISSNDGLVSIPGFGALAAVDFLQIHACPVLDSVGDVLAPGAVVREVYIWNCAALESLAFLAPIETLERNLKLIDLPALTSIAGLEALTAIGGDLYLHDLPGLSDLSPLSGLVELGGTLTLWDLSIVDVAPLAGLASIYGLDVRYNANLTSLSALAALNTQTSILGSITILLNPMLTAVPTFGLVETIEGAISINASPLLTVGPDLGSLVSARGGLSLVDLAIATVSTPRLADVGGTSASLTLWLLPNVTSLSFPALAETGTVKIEDNPAVTSALFPVLREIRGDFTINDNPLLAVLETPAVETMVNLRCGGSDLVALDFPSLDTAQAMWIGNSGANPQLTSVSMPSLASTSNIIIEYAPLLDTLDLSTLSTATTIRIEESALTAVAFPALESLSNTLWITGSPQVTSIDLPVLETVGFNFGSRLKVTGTDITTLSLPRLTAVNGWLELTSNPQLATLNLPLLHTVTATMSFAGDTALPTCAAQAACDQLALGPTSCITTGTDGVATCP